MTMDLENLSTDEIIQLYPETENSKTWDRTSLLIIGADKFKESWELIYFRNKYSLWPVFISCCLIIILIIYIKKRNLH